MRQTLALKSNQPRMVEERTVFVRSSQVWV